MSEEKKEVGPVSVSRRNGHHSYGQSYAARVNKTDAQKVAMFPIEQIGVGYEVDVRVGTFVPADPEDMEERVVLTLERMGANTWFLKSTKHDVSEWPGLFKVTVQ